MKHTDSELITSIIYTRLELENAVKNFEFAEAEMIDYYVYQIKASKAKLDYLIKKVKEQGIAIDILTDLDIKNNIKTAM